LIEIFKIAKAAKLINLTSVETLENLKDQLHKKENIFAAKKNNSRVFNASTLKKILADAGVAGAKQLVWGEPTPGSNKLSLAETSKWAVLLTDVLQGEGVIPEVAPGVTRQAVQQPTGPTAAEYGKKATFVSLAGRVQERFSRPTAGASPSATKTPTPTIAEEFDPGRCSLEGRNSYTLPEVQSLAQKYLISTDHDDDRNDICDKLTSHWTKWMAGRLRDFFRQRKCVSRSREELIKISEQYGVRGKTPANELSNSQLCEALTRKLFEMIFTARMTEFQVGDISHEVVDLIMQGKFDITSSGIDEKQRFAILAAASFLNPMLLEFIQVSDVKDPGVKKNMKAAFDFVQQGLSLLDSAVGELDPEEVQQAAEAVADRIVAEEKVKSREEAEVAQEEGLKVVTEKEEVRKTRSERTRSPKSKSFEEVILGGQIGLQDQIFIPDPNVTEDALQAFEVGSLDELIPTEEAKNIIRNMHIGRPSRRKGFIALDKGRTEVPYDGKEIEGISISGSRSLRKEEGPAGPYLHYIEGILLSTANEKRLREIIAENSGNRKDKIMSARSFRELVEAAHATETDAFIPSPETEEILLGEVFQVGSFEELLPTYEARKKILQGMLGDEVAEGGRPRKMVLGHGRLTVDYDGKEIDGIEIIGTQRVEGHGRGSPYNLHVIDGFVLGEKNKEELSEIIEANRRIPLEELPEKGKEEEEELELAPSATRLEPPSEHPTREEIPIPNQSPSIIIEPEDLQPPPEKANLYDVISNKPGLSIFTSFINAVPEAVKVLQGHGGHDNSVEILSAVIPDDAAVQAALKDTGNTVDSLMQNEGLKDYVLGYVTGRGEDLEKTKSVVPVLEEASNGTLRIVSYDLRMPPAEGMVEVMEEEEVIQSVPPPSVPIAEPLSGEERMVGKANIPEDYQLPEGLRNVIAANRVEKAKTVEPQVFVQEQEKKSELEEEEMAEVVEPLEEKQKTQVKTEEQPLEEYLNDLEGEGAPIRFFINLSNSFSSASVPAEGDVLTDQLQTLINTGRAFFLSIPSDDDFMEYFGVANDELGTIQILPIEKVEEFIISHLAILSAEARKSGATRHITLDETVIDEETLEIIAQVTLPGGSKLVSAEGTLPEGEREEEEDSEGEELENDDEEVEEVRPATVAPPKVSKRANLFEGDEDLLA